MKTTRNFTLFILLITLLSSCTKQEPTADAYGNFEADEVTISARANGTIEVLNLLEGEKLSDNEYLGYIDSTDLVLKRATLIQNKATVLSQIPATIEPEIAVLKQQLKNIEINLDRVKRLLKSKAATQKQLDDLQGQYDLAAIKIEAAEAKKQSIRDQAANIERQIDEVNDRIEKCKIINPKAGTVLTKFSYSGEFAAVGKPLYQIADLDYLTLKVYIDGTQLPHIKLGQKAEVLIDQSAESNQKLEGTVFWIASQAEFTPKIIQTKEERVNLVYAVKIRVKNSGILKIGMPGEANFQ